MIKLSEVPTGKKVKIKVIHSNLEIHSTLTGLGILPGDDLEVMARSIFGSPISFKHGECNFFALRKNQAELIEVE